MLAAFQFCVGTWDKYTEAIHITVEPALNGH